MRIDSAGVGQGDAGEAMNDESIWKAARAMQEAAAKAERAADRIEQAAQRIAFLLEDGYGGNGLRLLEALEKIEVKS